MTHLHITSWVLALILFGLALMFQKQGKAKPAKILQMVLRLDYLLILYSGGDLFASYSSFSAELIIKAISGLWLIAALEMILIKTGKGKSASSWWIQLIIALVIAIVLGFGRLPLGILLFG